MPPRVSTYMSSPVITASPSDNLAYIRNLMLRHKIGRVVIVEDGQIVGIISKTDFVRMLQIRRRYIRPLDTVLAREIMTSPVHVISYDKSIKLAAYSMLRLKISSLPVIDSSKRLVGIITKTDLVRAYRDKYHGKLKVSEVMITNPPVVERTHSIFYVIDLMTSSDVNRVIVIEGNKPVGIIAPSDIAFYNIEGMVSSRKYIKRGGISPRGIFSSVRVYVIPIANDVMTPDPLVIHQDEDLANAADTMIKNNIGTLPVIDDKGRLVGLVTKREIVKAIRML